MQELDNNKERDSQDKNTTEAKRRAVYEQPVFVNEQLFFDKFWNLASRFDMKSAIQLNILQFLLLSGSSKEGSFGKVRCVNESRFDSRKSLAKKFGKTEVQILEAEKQLRKKNFLASTGTPSKRYREYAVSEGIIEYFTGTTPIRRTDNKAGVTATPVTRVPATPVTRVPATLHSIQGNIHNRYRGENVAVTSINKKTNTTTFLKEHYELMNKVTGHAAPSVKNPPFQSMLEKYGSDAFKKVLTRLAQLKTKMVWEITGKKGEISIEKLSDIFADLSK